MEPPFEAHPPGTSRNKRSFGRELLRLVVYGLVIITISGAAFASQYGDDQTIQTLRTLKRAVSGLSPGLGIKSSEEAPKSLHQVTLQETVLVKDAGVMQSAPAQVTAESSHQVQQQLETIASNLATARSLVEQLTASQKQMALDIASMETSKDNFSQRTWWLSQSTAFHSAISKSQQKIVRSSPSPVTSARPKAQITPERLHRPELSSGMRRFDSIDVSDLAGNTVPFGPARALRPVACSHAAACLQRQAGKGRRRHVGAAGVPRAPQYPEHDALHGAGAGPR
jgi:hypothetical protein